MSTPVLYLRGDKEYGDLERYVAGLRNSGLKNVRGRLLRDCGHFAPDEQPAQVADAITEFIASQAEARIARV